LARSADQVAVMAAGRIVEYDTPQRLLTQDSAFRRLTRTQQPPHFHPFGPSADLGARIPDHTPVERT
jgi:ABC-type hemin transport system ATPase subunit